MEPRQIQPHHQIPPAAVLRPKLHRAHQQRRAGVGGVLAGIVNGFPRLPGGTGKQSPIRGQIFRDGAPGGIAAGAAAVVQIEHRQIPVRIRGIKQKAVHLQPADHPVPQAMDGGFCILEPVGGGGKGFADEIHAPQQGGGLLRSVLPGLAVQPQPGDLHHQGRADQQRDQRAQEQGGKKPVAEGIFQKAHLTPPSWHRPIGPEFLPGFPRPTGRRSPPGSAAPWGAGKGARSHHRGRSGGKTGCPAAAGPPG